jgi:hypothetical protein
VVATRQFGRAASAQIQLTAVNLLPNPKEVENMLKSAVCAGTIPLDVARDAIAAN